MLAAVRDLHHARFAAMPVDGDHLGNARVERYRRMLSEPHERAPAVVENDALGYTAGSTDTGGVGIALQLEQSHVITPSLSRCR